MTIDNILRTAAEQSAPRMAEGDYRQDGLLYCGQCHTPKECRVDWGSGEVVVGCVCHCENQAHEAKKAAYRAREYALEVDRLRVQGIQDRRIRKYTFQAATMTPLLEKCRAYVDSWEEMCQDNCGLLLWGGVGTGKTYAAACIANALIDRHIPALVTSFPRILHAGFDKAQLIDEMSRFPLLVVDDLGVERESSYALETVYMVVDERYKAGLPLIVTTNLTVEELRNPKNKALWRIYDRVLELCAPVLCMGDSRRAGRAEETVRRVGAMFDRQERERWDKGGD